MAPAPKSWIRTLILVTVVMFVFLQITLLSPSSLDPQVSSKGRRHSLRKSEVLAAIKGEGPKLAPGIPKDELPAYAIQTFKFISTKGPQKQWKLLANLAHLYNSVRMVHGYQVKAFLYDPVNPPTLVTGDESRYFVDKRDLEVYGNVVTTFPDGLVVKSDYMRYLPEERKVIIPDQMAYGETPVENEDSDDPKRLYFKSKGLIYDFNSNVVQLLDETFVTMEEKSQRVDKKTGKPYLETIRTDIQSDKADILKSESIARFTMHPDQPLNEKFVLMQQPNLDIKSRRADLHYGSSGDSVEVLKAFDDVDIQETNITPAIGPDGKPMSDTRYATCGYAEFDTLKNNITLRKFPQVYENNDTVTGEVIFIHRNTDIVEVKQSNAFSEGNE